MNAHWWKAWVLLTGLGVTILGWMAAPPEAPPAASTVGPTQASLPLDDASVLPGDPRGRAGQASRGTSLLPAMPQKPVFRSPVTRTRRS